MNPPRRPALGGTNRRLVNALVVALIGLLVWAFRQHALAPSHVTTATPPVSAAAPAPRAPTTGAAPGVLPDVAVENFGRVVYRGEVDLRPTLERIRRGERLRFRHDGIEFGNREHRLPGHPPGYYHEYVHPTPGLEGPGGQRVVVGAGGEVFYTPNHYRSFLRVR